MTPACLGQAAAPACVHPICPRPTRIGCLPDDAGPVRTAAATVSRSLRRAARAGPARQRDAPPRGHQDGSRWRARAPAGRQRSTAPPHRGDYRRVDRGPGSGAPPGLDRLAPAHPQGRDDPGPNLLPTRARGIEACTPGALGDDHAWWPTVAARRDGATEARGSVHRPRQGVRRRRWRCAGAAPQSQHPSSGEANERTNWPIGCCHSTPGGRGGRRAAGGGGPESVHQSVYQWRREATGDSATLRERADPLQGGAGARGRRREGPRTAPNHKAGGSNSSGDTR
jgi:hypothetical protein